MSDLYDPGLNISKEEAIKAGVDNSKWQTDNCLVSSCEADDPSNCDICRMRRKNLDAFIAKYGSCEVEPLTYRVECAWCDILMAVKETDDPNMAGAVSHGCCETCFEGCKEQIKEYKKKCDKEEALSVEDEVDFYEASVEMEVGDATEK